MSGTEAIINKIMGDARAVVNSTLEEANLNAEEILKTANNDAAIYLEQNMRASYAERDDIVRRRITNANLEVKKIMLKAKQDIIDKTFAKAAAAIKSDETIYKGYIASLLEFAENGDEVVLAEADRKTITKAFVKEKAKALGINIKISEVYGEFLGGIILTSEKTDKNLSLETELALIRNEIEPEIAEMLFGD